MMPSILDLKSKREIARQVHHTIVDLIKRANTTANSMEFNNIRNLYFSIQRAATLFTDLANKGYTIAIIGPIMGDEFDFDWTIYESEFTALKDNKMPAFIVAANNAEAAIHAEKWSGRIPLDTNVKNTLLPSIQAIANTTFES